MNSKNEVFEYLIDQLRQQVNSNPYKQQCEDLTHEVLSLKNQLRDASALVAELQKELENLGDEYRRALDYALSDVPEQSGCRKEDTQYNAWRTHYGARQPVPDGTMVFIRYRNGGHPKTSLDAKNRLWVWDGTYADIVEYKIDTQECEHEWRFYGAGFSRKCIKCGVIV